MYLTEEEIEDANLLVQICLGARGSPAQCFPEP